MRVLSYEDKQQLKIAIPYGTEQQQAWIKATIEHDSYARAAKALGVDRGNLWSSVNAVKKRAEKSGAYMSPGLLKATQSAALAPPEVQYGWLKSDEASIFVRPPKLEDGELDPLERIRNVFEGLTPAPTVPSPDYADSDLLTIYPLADVHLGMMAWGKETGEDYSTKIASDRVKSWVAQCVASAPPSETAIVLSVGDYFHANDQTNQTPASKHPLDTDTRHFNTLDVGIESLAAGIETAAAKHKRVIVHIIPGNHDPTAYMALMFPLFERYRDNPRIEVHKAPGEWFIRQHGKVMLAAHHGDKAKADQMVHAMADSYASLWGKTKHRFLFTGHKHHHKSADIGGVQWEQLRAVTARDAYAVSHAYTARAQLQAITYHRIHGEVSRVKVNGH